MNKRLLFRLGYVALIFGVVNALATIAAIYILIWAVDPSSDLGKNVFATGGVSFIFAICGCMFGPMMIDMYKPEEKK